jgi:hypothetical protein
MSHNVVAIPYNVNVSTLTSGLWPKLGKIRKKLKIKSRCVMIQTYSQGECEMCESVREELPLFSSAIFIWGCI